MNNNANSTCVNAAGPSSSTGPLDARPPACDNARMDSSILKAVGFVHLHVHSAYSLREGALTIETLAKLAKADAMPALAITDTNNLFGALEFSEKLAKSGVQPIIGAQTTVDFGDAAPAFWRGVERDNARAPIVLLAQNEAGYRNLMRLVSALWLDPKDGDEAHIPFAALESSEGLIALTGGPSGPIDRALNAGLASLAESRLEPPRQGFRLQALRRNPEARARFGARDRACSSSTSPTVLARRWSRPTSPISLNPPTTRRTTRCSASRKARSSRRPNAGACRPSTGSRRAPR